MKKLLYLFCLVSISSVNSQNQTDNFFSTPKSYPVAPSAYEFAKYGNIPVSYYTGIPNVSIPIYTIEAGANDLQIPISLSYHSNGFKVNEESGWTGLGWTLNAGGQIIQQVNGYDDFKKIHPNRTLPDIDAIINVTSNGNAPVDYWSANGNYVGQTYPGVDDKKFGYLQYSGHVICGNQEGAGLVPRGLFGISESYDFEPDIFSFNFLGYSGKFVLDWNTESFKCLTDPKIKVEQTGSDHKSISITVAEGHIFVFELKEEAPERGLFYDSCADCDTYNGTNGDEAFLYGASSRVYKLTEIYTNKGNQLSFSYISTPLLENFHQPKQEIRSKTYLANRNFNSIGNGNTKNMETFSYLNNITFNGGTVSFISTNNRLDFIGTYKLDRIEFNSHAGDIVKTFDFTYDYFVGHTNGTVDSGMNPAIIGKSGTELTHRLKLLSVQESGKPPYTFDYNAMQLPRKNSRARDYWGYYNGHLTNSSNLPDIYRFN